MEGIDDGPDTPSSSKQTETYNHQAILCQKASLQPILLIIGLFVAIGLILFGMIPMGFYNTGVKTDVKIDSQGVPLTNVDGPTKKHIFPQHNILIDDYALDFRSLMKERHEAMKQFSFPYSKHGVDKREKLSLEEFRAVYDGKWPVIVTDAVPKWPALNWTRDFFISHYGDEIVAMKAVHNTVSETLSLPLKLYLSHLDDSSQDTWTYLTDELFLVQRPGLRSQILETVYTEDNYFYIFPNDVQPWDCMLLWGTAHSRSTLHIDPYNWTGTNAVLYGKKLWKLLPPGQDQHLSLSDLRNCGFPMDCVKYNSPLDAFVPDTLEKLRKSVHILEFEQNPGEILFIPTGWFHQAYNLIPTLAVSGQMMNENNYMVVLEEIIKGGSISRSDLPLNADQMSPRELVTYFASKISPEILRRGAKVTADALMQMKPSEKGNSQS